jgi:hypothetical protein
MQTSMFVGCQMFHDKKHKDAYVFLLFLLEYTVLIRNNVQ